jgi:pimeloyl-ACP methyl ester carboxylesterase
VADLIARTTDEQTVRVEAGGVTLEGNLAVPPAPRGVVLFAHGSGSSRHSPRNRYVAGVLNGLPRAQGGEAGLATLLVDLLTSEEEVIDLQTRHLRFDIDLLAERLVGAVDWLAGRTETRDLPVGLFGASTGAAAALVAAAERPERAVAVVSRGGRPDLAGAALPRVQAPTLLIVGGRDVPVISLNEEALARLGGEKRLEIVPDATHLFEEAGALERVASLARGWFERHLTFDQATRRALPRDAAPGVSATS